MAWSKRQPHGRGNALPQAPPLAPKIPAIMSLTGRGGGGTIRRENSPPCSSRLATAWVGKDQSDALLALDAFFRRLALFVAL